jgi:LacI family transcriptional regulator
VCVNNLVIGRTGAEHFQNLGLKRALYLQPESGPGFVQRQRGFLTRCQELGVACASLEVPGRWEDGYWLDEDRLGRLRAFLEASQKPLGIMAAVDTLGVHTLSLCQELQIRVPDDAAVLGVGNDELLCDFAWPSMSSLDVNARRVGYQAAALLQQTLNGETNGLVSEETLIEPYGVVARESTDMLAVNDPVVAESVRFIRANACKGISVVDVVRQLPLARRAFERRFLRQMKRTPLQEIRRVQVEAARWMLEHTDHPVALVASRAGFRDPKYFSKAFRMETGVPPTEYRKDSEAGRDKSAYAL